MQQSKDQSVWQFYTNSSDAWDAMLSAIASAEHSIRLEQFILSYDSIGRKFIDLLEEKASEGVRVRILADEAGSFSLFRSGVAKSLTKLGVEIKFFNSILPWSINKETFWFFRDHRKLLIIDNKIGFTGGVCLGDAMRNWRESSVRIEGPVVAQMITSFDVMWNKLYRKFKFYFRKKNKNLSLNYDFNYITNAPLPGKRNMYYQLVKAIRTAEHYIYLTTPYLIPDSRLLRELKKATKRGVEVRILIPLETDHKIATIGASTFYSTLLMHGVRLFRYTENMIHSKTGVIDGRWSTIGSLNLDNLSLRYNFEANLVSTDRKFAFELERQFLEDIRLARELTHDEWSKRGLIQRLLEIIVWPLRKLL